MKKNAFDNIIKEKAEAHEAAVPADAWDNINKQKKKRRFGVFWLMGTIAFLLPGILITYQFTTHSPAIITLVKTSDNNGDIRKQEPNTQSNTVNNNRLPAPLTTQDSTTNYSSQEASNTIQISESNKISLVTAATGKGSLASIATKTMQKNISCKNKIARRAKEPGANSTVKKSRSKNYNRTDNEDVTTNKKVKKGFKGKTTVTSKAPATALEDDNNDIAVNDSLIYSENKDSVLTTAEPVAKNKKQTVTDSSLTAHKKENKKQLKRKLFVDASMMPFLTIQKNASLTAVKRTTVTASTLSEFTADEISTHVDPSFSYTMALRKKIAPRFYIGAGMQYAKIKETVNLSGKETNTNYTVVKRLDNSGLFLVDDTVTTITNGIRSINAVNSYDFISIPVFFQYRLLQNRSWQLLLSGGLNFNISHNYKNSIDGTLVPSYTSTHVTNKRSSAITTNLFTGIRFSKSIGKNFALYAEPTLEFNFMRYNMPNMVNYKNIHRAGIAIGISYQLNY